MSDLLREQLSAFVDGELPREECTLLIKRIGNSIDLARTWHAYHLIGDALRDELCDSAAQQLAPRVREALTEEVVPPVLRRHNLRRWSTVAAGAAVLSLAGLAGALISSHMQTGKVFAPGGTSSSTVTPMHVDWRRAPAPVQYELNRYLLMHDPYGMSPTLPTRAAQSAATSPAANRPSTPTPP